MITTESHTKNSTPLWVKFKKDNGAITRISPKEIRANSSNFGVTLTESIIAKQILQGKVSSKTVKVIKVLNENAYELVEQTSTLELKNLSFKLHKIKNSNPYKSDLNVNIFTDTGNVELTINIDNIKTSMNVVDINELIVTENTYLNLYVTKKDNPDHLVTSIEVDPVLLFKNKKLKIATDLSQSVDWNNISIYTTPIFYNYSVTYSTSDAVSEISHYNKYLHEADQSNEQAHINIQKSNRNNELIINSSLINDSNVFLFDGKKSLVLVVCDTVIDNLLGGFVLKTRDLVEKNVVRVLVDFDLPKNPVIIYRCDNLKINYTGD